jgi:SAM-dependent methyltransferase
MPQVDWNKRTWEAESKWRDGGDRWSNAWGGPQMQWHGTLLPRIHSFLPTGTILELGPGFGRWTEFLQSACERLIVVDLSQACIAACRARFRAQPHVECHTNDGKSLDIVPDGSIDFVFSFDSLVHVEADVIDAYLEQLAKKMKPDGIGFIHHSNLARYRDYFRCVRGVPLLRTLLRPLGFATRTHDRGATVSAESFARSAEAAGLQCIGQEWINWDSPLLIDCISTFTPKGSVWDTGNRVVRNRFFMDEARCIQQRASLAPQRRAA